MEVQEFELQVSSLRIAVLAFLMISPVIYSSFLAALKIEPDFRAEYVLWSAMKTYGVWFIIFLVLIFTPALLWGLEGKISERVFIQLTHPQSIFTTFFNYFLGLIAICASILVPIWELRRCENQRV
ncbi:hypothetical protein [Microbulbifer hydrolyticus]|uniref:hypothetical protein n=1 Tax=Microbulbifer hydrolyticus TaxID=48074 RepID=UPI001F3F4EF7|nr:hypothetical protein [Microbulbifer hydrolyticus]